MRGGERSRDDYVRDSVLPLTHSPPHYSARACRFLTGTSPVANYIPARAILRVEVAGSALKPCSQMTIGVAMYTVL